MVDFKQLLQGGAPSAVPNSGGNPVAASTAPGVFGSHPVLTPDLQAQMAKLMGEYVYSLPNGGYIPADQAANANSYYNKFSNSGSSGEANKAMADFYASVGDLPQQANVSPALAKFNEFTGATPKLGPSLNENLAALLAGPTGEQLKKAGFGPKYEGPFNIPGF